jgi:hypothetical protein
MSRAKRLREREVHGGNESRKEWEAKRKGISREEEENKKKVNLRKGQEETVCVLPCAGQPALRCEHSAWEGQHERPI